MAALVGSETVSTSNGSNLTCPVPAGTQNDDVMIAAVWCDRDVAPNPPGGWTEIVSSEVNGFAEARMFYRIASGEPANYSWTMGGSNFPAGVGQFVFRSVGGGTGNPVMVAATGGTGNPGSQVTAPQVITSGGSVILTFCVSQRDGSVVFHDSPDGGTELADWGEQSGASTVSGALYSIDKDAAAAYAFHVNLSGGSVGGVSLFTVALEAGSNEGVLSISMGLTDVDVDVSAEATGTLTADMAAEAPVLTMAGVSNLVRCELEPVAPMAVVDAAGAAEVSAQAAITTPLARTNVQVLRDLFATVTVATPFARMNIGAETRIFGARVVVVRPEDRTRYP